MKHLNRGGIWTKAKYAMVFGGLVKSPWEDPVAHVNKDAAKLALG